MESFWKERCKLLLLDFAEILKLKELPHASQREHNSNYFIFVCNSNKYSLEGILAFTHLKKSMSSLNFIFWDKLCLNIFQVVAYLH